MTRARLRAAVSAVVMSLGLSGVGLLVVAPFAGPSAAGATVVVEPSEIPGCDVDAAGPCEEPTPIVTVTVTESPEETPAPQQTVTTTVTVPPKTKPPKTTQPAQTTRPAQPTVPDPVVPPAETAPIAPPTTPPVAESTPTSQDPQFPASSPSATLPPVTPPAEESTPLDEGASATSVTEIRNAGSDYDGATLSRTLGIPALILVLLVLFAVLIFEGRLRRLAHAAAIRRAGPRGMGYRGEPLDPMPYPAGPGYAPNPYQGGTAYAPIISFVPMQMYAPVYPEGYAPEYPSYGPPHGYEQTAAYPPGYEQPAAGHGPVSQDGSTAAFQHAPQVGPEPHRGDLPRTAFPQEPAEFPGAPFPQEPPRSGPASLGDPVRDGHPGEDGPPPAGLASTAVYPVPGRDATKENAPVKKKRGLFRRSS